MATSRLFVLLGAGASRGAVDGASYLPPLTRELFDPRFNRILLRYPAVDTAAAEIRRAISSSAVALEEHLAARYVSSDAREHARQTGRTLPLYFQEVLTEASCCAWEPRSYDLLWRAILDRVEAVTFITLNYDTILDERLGTTAPLRSLDDYIAPDRPWNLIKLHGSINWGYLVDNGQDQTGIYDAHRPATTIRKAGPIEMARFPSWAQQPTWHTIVTEAPAAVLAARLAPTVQAALQESRGNPGRPLFPALALPLGAQDEFVCPDKHLEHLRGQLDNWEDAALLVIGYSAVDSSVLNELRRCDRFAACLVVDHDFYAAAAVARRLADSVAVPQGKMLAFEGDFAAFVADEQPLTAFLADPQATVTEISRDLVESNVRRIVAI